MSLYLEKNGRGLCWDTVMHFMGYEFGERESKWEALPTIRYMMKEGYCRETMAALFEDACDRWSMGGACKEILRWLQDPNYKFPVESIFWEGDEE